MHPTRRDVLGLGATAALSLVPGIAPSQGVASRAPRRSLRIAHICDLHVQPERQAALGMEACLEKAQAYKPDMIFLGGDMVMDCLTCNKDRAREQWDLFERVLRSNVSVKVEACLGNHDIWGWERCSDYQSDAYFGKRYPLDRLELDRAYRSFNRAGWHIVILDSSSQPRRGNGYVARLDDAQFEWLEDDLKSTPRDQPVLIVSHMPILSACAYMHGLNESSGDWRVPGRWMHIDARRIKNLFRKHPNVNACISGHIHLVDHVRYLDVSYYCNGAACGAWWGGPFQECGNGFAIVDLYSNGMVDNRYIEFDWTPRP